MFRFCESFDFILCFYLIYRTSAVLKKRWRWWWWAEKQGARAQFANHLTHCMHLKTLCDSRRYDGGCCLVFHNGAQDIGMWNESTIWWEYNRVTTRKRENSLGVSDIIRKKKASDLVTQTRARGSPIDHSTVKNSQQIHFFLGSFSFLETLPAFVSIIQTYEPLETYISSWWKPMFTCFKKIP